MTIDILLALSIIFIGVGVFYLSRRLTANEKLTAQLMGTAIQEQRERGALQLSIKEKLKALSDQIDKIQPKDPEPNKTVFDHLTERDENGAQEKKHTG